jgi:hypothetical protein
LPNTLLFFALPGRNRAEELLGPVHTYQLLLLCAREHRLLLAASSALFPLSLFGLQFTIRWMPHFQGALLSIFSFMFFLSLEFALIALIISYLSRKILSHSLAHHLANRSCPSCGYSLLGAVRENSPNCPECGARILGPNSRSITPEKIEFTRQQIDHAERLDLELL